MSEDIDDDELVMMEGQTVVDIVNHLLQLVLAFVGPDEAKKLIDQATATEVAAQANQLELAKFGKGN